MSISDRLNTIRHRIAGVQPEEHEARLLQLYWNRAELKKELSRLQDERYKLLEQLRAAYRPGAAGGADAGDERLAAHCAADGPDLGRARRAYP